MVVGRRRVAAASVATAYALHVYVLQHHFRPPQTDRPSLPLPTPSPNSSPIAEKLVRNARIADTPRGCWCPPPPPFPSPSHSLSHSRSSRPFLRFSRTDSLDPPRPFSTLRRAAHTPLAHTYVLPSSYTSDAPRRAAPRREAPGRTVPYRAHPLSHSGLSPSIRPLLTFSFFCSDFLPLFLHATRSRLGPSQRPTPELK